MRVGSKIARKRAIVNTFEEDISWEEGQTRLKRADPLRKHNHALFLLFVNWPPARRRYSPKKGECNISHVRCWGIPRHMFDTGSGKCGENFFPHWACEVYDLPTYHKRKGGIGKSRVYLIARTDGHMSNTWTKRASSFYCLLSRADRIRC